MVDGVKLAVEAAFTDRVVMEAVRLDCSTLLVNLTSSYMARLSQMKAAGSGEKSGWASGLKEVAVGGLNVVLNFRRNSSWGSFVLNSLDKLE